MKEILNSYRKNTPSKVVDVAVVCVEDYLTGLATLADGSTEQILLPRENVLKFNLEDGSWIAIRPSGTEPKCKFYLG